MSFCKIALFQMAFCLVLPIIPPEGILPNGILPNGILPNGILPNGILPNGILPNVILLYAKLPSVSTAIFHNAI